MRLNEEGPDEEEGVAVTSATPAPVALSPPPAASSGLQRLVVGYALTKKKVKSFLQPKLLALARKKGINFVPIDETCPLSEQGPFDIILHKRTNKDWQQVLEDYREEHPEVTVLDPPSAIQHLHNRQSMLQEVADLNLSNSYGEVRAPRQLVIMKDPSSIPAAVAKAGLTLPLGEATAGYECEGIRIDTFALFLSSTTVEVAKPLVVDGTSKSHQLSLAYVDTSLSMLDPPLVLQEFVNHGGILFKVYIVGETIRVVRRFSLPDVNDYDMENNEGIFPFPRVSCATNNAEDADIDPSISELPPRPLLEKLGKELRRRLGLRLFNLDMIREHGRKDRYYVIDINYFPGYGKMPGYEHVFTDFLLGLVQSKYKRRLSGS